MLCISNTECSVWYTLKCWKTFDELMMVICKFNILFWKISNVFTGLKTWKYKRFCAGKYPSCTRLPCLPSSHSSQWETTVLSLVYPSKVSFASGIRKCHCKLLYNVFLNKGNLLYLFLTSLFLLNIISWRAFHIST